jgi:dihydroorotate dehydrogenase electron transfer subunit
MVLANEVIARNAQPGQFVNVRVMDSLDPLLRRPFSVYACNPEHRSFSLLFDIVGRGTKLLAAHDVGDFASVVGPLGRGFDLGSSAEALHVLVAGGCGAAPLHFLSDAICRHWGCEKATVLVGARSGDAVLCEREFRGHGAAVGISTEDGSYGYHGLVTNLLQQHLSSLPPHSNVRVYSCGPMPMMREVWRIAKSSQVTSCQLSLETSMACGLGVCMGCVVKGCNEHDKSCGEWDYRRVCTEGPVFNAEELVWE